MPQVDLETLVSACAGGNKVACETLSDPFPDAPQSFRLSKDSEFDWFDRSAFGSDRHDSTKGVSKESTRNPNPNPVFGSQRFSHVKSKASVIGLPKNQKAAYAEAKNRRNVAKPGSVRLFPKRTGSKPVEPEPGSPKVSCIGRVRSRRDRNRQRSKRSTDSKEAKERTKRSGFFESFRSVFGRKKSGEGKDKGSARGERFEEPPAVVRVRTGDIRDRLPASERHAPRESVDEPVGLGGMNRFSSGRRTIQSLGVDVA